MKTVELNLTKNPLGSDPLVNFYQLLNEQYPEDNLTLSNSKVFTVYNYQNQYTKSLARVAIVRNEDPVDVLVYFVKRFDLRRFIQNPFFSNAELAEVQAIDNSYDLMRYIANKTGLNLTTEDLLVERSYIEYSGGSVTPNWLLNTREQSLWFYGHFNLWLHGGADD